MRAFKKKLQVFISSTYRDLKLERQAAVEAILRSGHIPAGMELFSAGNESQAEVVRRWIDESDVYMLILGGRYGSIEPRSGKSYVEMEYRHALESGKPSFAVVMSGEALDKKIKDLGKNGLELENRAEFEKFREFVLTKMSRFFDDEKDIKMAVLESLGEIINRYPLTGWIRGSEISGSINLLDRKGRDIELGDPVERILNAKKEVWITGTTLNAARSGAWRGFEDTDAKIKVILPDFTRDSIMEATAITDNRISKNIPYENGLEEQRKDTKESWEFFSSSETKAGRVEVKLLPYSPCYSIFAVDADYACKADGYISVEIIGYHYKPKKVPGLVLLKNRKEYSEFYNLLLSMWNEMWEDAHSHGKGE